MEQKVGVKIIAEDKASKAFKAVTKSAKGFDRQAGSLSGSLKKLAGAMVGLLAFRKITQLLGSATKAAEIQELMEMRLAASLKQSVGATKEQIKELTDYAGALQKVTTYGDEQIIGAMGVLGTFQMTSDQIKESTIRLLDMAAGTESATGETQDLKAIALALGRAITLGAGALTRYGVVMTDSEKKTIDLATGNEKLMLILNALDKNYQGIAKAMGDTYAGQVTQFKNAWGDLKEEMGMAVLMATGPLTEAFTVMIEGFSESGDAAVGFYNILSKLTLGYLEVGDTILDVWDSLKIGWEKFQLWLYKDKAGKEFEEKHLKIIREINQASRDRSTWLDILARKSEKSRVNLTNGTKAYEEALALMKAGKPITEELGDASEETAEKTANAFETMAKSIVNQFEKQTEAVRDLRKELDDLSKDVKEQLGEAEESYNENLSQMARNTKDKIDTIDESIADERKSKQRGWRDRITDLEKEKKQELAILSRIGKEGISVQDEIAKDELAVLKEKHQKELAEIRNQGIEKKREMDRQLMELEQAGVVQTGKITAPGFFDKAATEQAGVRGWETGVVDNIFNFNFEGEVSDREALMQQIMVAINRAAELKQFSGQ